MELLQSSTMPSISLSKLCRIKYDKSDKSSWTLVNINQPFPNAIEYYTQNKSNMPADAMAPHVASVLFQYKEDKMVLYW